MSNEIRMSSVFDYYKQLAQAFGPSGREDAVREQIGSMAADLCDDMSTDPLGNLICHKRGAGKRIAIAAHMDSTGFAVTHIDSKGFLRFGAVGGLFRGDLVNIQVRFENGTRGVVSYEEKTPFKELTLDHMFIDIGAANREAAAQRVQPGDFAVYEAPVYEQDGILCGPYLDNRIGCTVLLLAMASLPAQTANDLYFIFTTQEEVGLRGAGPAAYGILPDYAIAVDVTDTGDLPEHKYPMACHMGKGAAVKVMDRSVICSPVVRTALEEAAASLGLPVQREVLLFGGTDTSALQKTGAGVPAGALSIPTRYVHSPSEMCAVRDVADAAAILAKVLQTL